MSAQIEFVGLSETIENLDRIEQDLTGAPIVNAMQDATLYVTRDARKNAPVDQGALRASIMPSVTSTSNSVTGVVGSNKVYAPPQEYGTRPFWPPTAALEGWARRHGTVAFLVARAIARRGIRARRYLSKALDDNREKIIRRFKEAVGEIVR